MAFIPFKLKTSLWAPPLYNTTTSYFVAPSDSGGNDNNDGSINSPFLTLTKAQSAMQAGSIKVTYIRAGNFNISATMNLSNLDNNTWYLAYPNELPIISTSTLSTVINANNVNNLTFYRLSFQGEISATDKLFLELHSCSNCNIIANHFINNNSALLLAGTTNSILSGNQFDNHAFCAIELKDGANFNIIDSNKFTGITNTTNPTTGGAVYAHGVNYNIISHNDISNTTGGGISVSNFDGPTGPIYTINVGNEVNYNKLTNCCTQATDNGAIYTVGRAEIDTRLRIIGNYIDGINNNNHALGIYLDDEANNVWVQNNIVRGVIGSNVAQFHAGKNCYFVNNIFDFSAGSLGILFQDATYSPSTQTNAAGTIGPNYVQRNIFWSSTSGGLIPYVDISGGSRAISNNLYPVGTNLSSPNNDTSPIFGDPLFKNASAGNYALGLGSAALNIGFEPIDQSLIGLNPRTPHWY